MYKRRTVRCEIHGLHYDPQLTKGCLRCRKEGLSEPPAKPQFLPLLLILLGFTLVGGLLADRLFKARAANLANAGLTTATSAPRGIGQLDPELYRPQLLELESALDAGTADFTVLGGRVTAAAFALGAALRRAGAHQAAGEVVAFGRSLTADELDLDRLERARNVWNGLRDRTFRSAPWLRRQPGSVDRTTVALHHDVASDLLDLVQEGVDAAAATDVDWPRWSEQWLERITALRDRLPPPPPYDTDPRLLVARRELDGMFSELQTLARDSIPSTARPRLETIAESLAQSRRDFDDVLG